MIASVHALRERRPWRSWRSARYGQRQMKALLFDLDGTLADTNPLHQLAWYEVLREHGIEADAELYARHIAGRRNVEIVASILPQLSRADALATAEDKEARFRRLAGSGLRALPGVPELLAVSVRRSWATALVTNAPRANAELVLGTLQLRFDVTVLGEDLPVGKPDPLPYAEALRLLGAVSANALAFEDSPSGVRSSVGAGIRTVGILSGHTTVELQAAGAELCVADFSAPELQTLLTGWGAG
jgi:HAD superfamily hydrolase (TIGR01509 family)